MRQYINLLSETVNPEVIQMMTELNISIPYSIVDDSLILKGNVSLQHQDLSKLPFEEYGFKIYSVEGHLDVGFNNFETLEGFPERVEGRVRVLKNRLKTLKGIPKYIGQDINVGIQNDNVHIDPWETRYAFFSNIILGIYFEGHLNEQELESIHNRFQRLPLSEKENQIQDYLERLKAIK